jgi:hypothetical protein
MCLLMCKYFNGFFFHHIHFLFIAFTALLKNMLDFRYGNYGEKLGEKEIAGKE